MAKVTREVVTISAAACNESQVWVTMGLLDQGFLDKLSSISKRFRNTVVP
jgi:hypothetical protein